MITKCDKHKNYKAKAKPKANCDVCWGMWLYAQVRLARETTLPNTMTEQWLFTAIRNHRHAVERK